MEVLDCELYCQVEDRYGAKATIYESPYETHRVIYEDNNGNRFFREDFKRVSIESVEQAVIDWALGKRELQINA